MNIKDFISVGTAVTSKAVGRANKFSPEILIGVGIVGLVTAGILAARATLKVEPIIDEVQTGLDTTQDWVDTKCRGYTDATRRKDLVKIYGRGSFEMVKLYGPSVTLAAASIACVLGGHHILKNRNVALAAAYKLVEASYSEYRKRVVSEIGEEREAKIYRGQYKQTVVNPDTGKKMTVMVQSENGHSPYSRFFDDFNSPNEYKKNRPDLNQFFLLSVQRYMNQRLKARGYLFLNEVYHALGMDDSAAGQVVGWMANTEYGGDGYVDFGIDDPDNEMARMFLAGEEAAILLDFNVDGLIYKNL